MKKLIVIALAALTLTGCASIDNGREVDCTAKYTGGTFGINQGSEYPVHINRVKTTHTGAVLVRPQSNLDIHFQGGYQAKNTFHNYECKKDNI